MRVTSIDATPFSLRRKAVVKARTTAGDRSNHVLVQVRTDDGPVGTAEALSKVMIYGETQASIVAIIQEKIAPLLVGLDPLELDEADRRLSEVPANNSARAAVDIALHDLVGQIAGLPLHRLWGGSRTVQLVSWTVGIRAPQEMADEAAAMNRDHGINAFKVKGGETPTDDVEAIRLIRQALPAAQISLDANEGYTAKTAIRTLTQMSQYDVAYVEEPIPHHDRLGRVEAARAIPMPILGDDSCFTLPDVMRELELGAIGMISIKTPRTGFSQSFKILGMAEANGVPCVVGTAVGGALSSVAALQFSCSRASLSAPSENSFGINLHSDIVRNAPAVAGGRLEVPQGPGLGVEVSAEDLAALTAAGRDPNPAG
jgi:L-alanine-DL-glutamate epimerase-like enolase superfamily enzyme